MKLIVVFLIVVTFQVSAKTVAQKITLSRQNVSLVKVFREIRKQTGYQFFYEDELIKQAKNVAVINVKNAIVQEVLDLCFKDQPFTYEIVEKAIVIKQKPKEDNIVQAATSPPPQTEIHGKVTDENGKPIPGVSVTITGTKKGTTTDNDGNYIITVSANATLEFSFIGYKKQTVTAENKTEINITLTAEVSALNEVVVVGYGTQRKSDITGSVSVVNVKDLKSVPAGTTESLLQGQASGVTVINSGAPGGYSNLRIRGITSLGNSDPLIILDGVQSDLHDLNPNDIESIQVLKDAGSAAIYGIQGSNGVIIVTTKKGAGAAKLSYDAYVGMQRPLKNGFNLANTSEYADVLFRQAFNSGSTSSNSQFGMGAAPVIPDYITPQGTFEGDPNTDPSTYDIDNNQITRANKSGTDWFHEAFKPAIFQNHTISASAGSAKSSFYAALNYVDQQGTLINTYLKRYEARINTTFNIKNNIRFGENVYAYYRQNPQIQNQNDENAIASTYQIPPIIPVYDIMGNYAGTKSGGLGNASNPVAVQQRGANDKGNDWVADGNFFAELDFLKHFTARTSFGGNIDNYYYYFFNYTPYENAEGNTNSNSFTEGAGYNSLWLWTNTLTYNNVFGAHSLKLLGGSEAKNIYSRNLSAGRSNYYSTNPNFWTLNTGDPNTGYNYGGAPDQLAEFSLFARVDYSYADKYLLSGTFRYDKASVFAPENNSGSFPSVSAGWKISEEKFMKDITWINELKFRGSYGQLGSISNINSTNPYNLYGSDAGFSYYAIESQTGSANQGFYLSQFGNVHTTFEKDIVSNIGLDATLFHNKLDFSVEVYKKTISGLLYQAQPAIGNFLGGASQPFINLGNIKNTGIDVSGSYHYTKRDFKLDITATVTSYKNEVVSLPPGYNYVDAGDSRIGNLVRNQPGEPIGSFFGYEVIGFFQNHDDVAKSPTQSGAKPGRFKYRDVDDNGTINDNDRTFFGNPNPDFSYGLNIGASYKNWDLSSFFYGSKGNDVLNYVRYWTDFPQVFGGNISKDAVNNSVILVNAQTGELTNVQDPKAMVQNPGAKVPVLEENPSFSTTTVPNSYYKENGSYFRCKQIQIGYSIPATILKRVNIDKFRIYIQAVNLFTITNYTGLDPELQGANQGDNSNFGIDYGNYPANQKSYYVGVSVTF